MRNKKTIAIITLGLIGTMLLSACNVSGSNTVAETDLTILSAVSTAPDTLATTETAAQTETTKTATPTPTEKPTVTPTVTPTITPETSATTVATTTAAPTAKPTKAPTQPTQTTAPAATTKATEPAPTTTKATTPRYTENPDAIREGIVQYAKDNGLWFPDAEVKGNGSMSAELGFMSSDQRYIDAFIKGKITGKSAIVSVSCWIESGWLHMSFEIAYLPTPAPTAAPPPETTPAPPPADTPTPSP